MCRAHVVCMDDDDVCLFGKSAYKRFHYMSDVSDQWCTCTVVYIHLTATCNTVAFENCEVAGVQEGLNTAHRVFRPFLLRPFSL